MKKFRISTKSAGQRADIFLAKKLGYSRSSLEQLFDLGKVKIQDQEIKTGYKLKVNDLLQADTALFLAQPASIEIPTVYEDNDVIVLNKPAGVLTHSKGALNTEATIASFIKPKLNDKGLTGNRAGIVHRLDRATSGLIICARNEPALKWLQKQFSTRKVMKEYLAVVDGVPVNQQAKIDVPIARNPARPSTFKVSSSGKPAQTMYKIEKSFRIGSKTYSLVRLWPYSGRTNQIRIHMAYIGNPLLGDTVYGKSKGRMLLHAVKLELALPDGEIKKFSAPAPEYFRKFEHGL